MAGSAIVRQLIADRHLPCRIVTGGLKQLNLIEPLNVRQLLERERPYRAYLAKVCGVDAGIMQSVGLIYQSLVELNVALRAAVRKLLLIGSSLYSRRGNLVLRDLGYAQRHALPRQHVSMSTQVE